MTTAQNPDTAQNTEPAGLNLLGETEAGGCCGGDGCCSAE